MWECVKGVCVSVSECVCEGVCGRECVKGVGESV